MRMSYERIEADKAMRATALKIVTLLLDSGHTRKRLEHWNCPKRSSRRPDRPLNLVQRVNIPVGKSDLIHKVVCDYFVFHNHVTPFPPPFYHRRQGGATKV